MAASDFHDPDLTPLLRDCANRNREDLQALVDFIKSSRTNTFGKATKHQTYADPTNRLVDDIVYEIRTFGGNTFANVARRDGVAYAEIVGDVCSKMKVKTPKGSVVEAQELALLLRILDQSLERMSPEERQALEEEFRRAGMKNLDLGAGVPIATLIAQGGVQLTGFLAYRIAVIVANAVAKAVLGRGLSLAANAALTRVVGILVGPIGWAVTGIWTAVDLAGPAYRVTIPCVCHVAFLRQKRKFEDLAEA